MQTHTRIRTRTCVHTHTNTYMSPQPLPLPHTHARTNRYRYTNICVYIHIYMTDMCINAYIYIQTYKHTYTLTRIHAYTHTRIHKKISTNKNKYKFTQMCAYVRTYAYCCVGVRTIHAQTLLSSKCVKFTRTHSEKDMHRWTSTRIYLVLIEFRPQTQRHREKLNAWSCVTPCCCKHRDPLRFGTFTQHRIANAR